MNAPTHSCQSRMMAYRLLQIATFLGVLLVGGGSSLLAQSLPTSMAAGGAAASTEQAGIAAGSPTSLLRERGVGIGARRSVPVIPKAASPAAGSWDSTPRWLRWGLVGAVAGAVAFPLLGGLSGSDGNAAGDALAGAAVGFIILGGAVALWDALCAGQTSSRRAGLCGR